MAVTKDAATVIANSTASSQSTGIPAGTTAPLYLARAVRDFGDGFVAVLLPVYLMALGFGAFEVGVVATAPCSARPQ